MEVDKYALASDLRYINRHLRLAAGEADRVEGELIEGSDLASSFGELKDELAALRGNFAELLGKVNDSIRNDTKLE